MYFQRSLYYIMRYTLARWCYSNFEFFQYLFPFYKFLSQNHVFYFPYYSITSDNLIDRVVVCFVLIEKWIGELFEIYQNSSQKSLSHKSMIESLWKTFYAEHSNIALKFWSIKKKTLQFTHFSSLEIYNALIPQTYTKSEIFGKF